MATDDSPADLTGLPVEGPVDPTVVTERTRQLLARAKGKHRYLLQRELARGGMGVVNVAVDQDLQRISAMKVIAEELKNDERRLKAFIEEGRITARLEHPNIVPVHEIGIRRETGQPFYTMKLVSGESLCDIIWNIHEGSGDYPRRYNRHALLDIFRKVCNAIAYAHSQGVIHRDIKPENIMVGEYGEVLLMDWGLAKYVDSAESKTQSYLAKIGADQASLLEETQDGIIKGSLAYISPEQAFGELSQVDEKTDIFLLGATLYHMFTHFPPYQSENLQEILRKAETCDFQAPGLRNPNAQIPLALERIILKAMSPLKENRYASVNELIDDLDAFIAGKRVSGRKIFSPGEDLIRHGEQSQETYVIISGKVEVFRHVDGHKSRIATLGAGEIIGEMAGITHKVRSATVRAVESTEVLVISHELMLEELEKLPPWMEKVVFSMADRVQTLDHQIHPYLLVNCSFPVVNQIYLTYLSLHGEGWGKAPDAVETEQLIREVTINTGLDKSSIAPVLDVLVRGHLCALDRQNRAYVPNMDLLRLFVEFCRRSFEITDGIRSGDSLKLSHDQDVRFRGLIRKLADL